MKPAATPPAPLRGARLVFATLALGLASFMNILDMTIANVSVPTIAGDFGVSYSQGTWIITSYAVAEAVLLPLTGWLAQRFGQIRMFLFATLTFTLASLMCGISVDFPMLLAARVLQGVVGASMIPLSQTLMPSIFPPAKRGMALGLWSMTTVLAPVVGPLAGGWLTEALSWHWVFLINLPIGLVVAGVVWSLLRDRETPTRKLPIDYVGLGLLTVGVGALQILLDKGNEMDWFGSGEIVALACVSAVAIAFFVLWELGEEHPVVDLRLFARRNFLVGAVALFVGMVAYFGIVVVQPLWLQSQQGYTPYWAGKMVSYGGVLAIFLGPVIGANIHRLDARAVATFGFVVMAGVSLWNASFTPDVDFDSLVLARFTMGLGIACFFLPIMTINMSGLPVEKLAAASGLSNFMRNLGSSFGTALMVSFWGHRAIAHHALLTEHVSSNNPQATEYLDTLAGMGLGENGALAQLDRVINNQAYLMATNDMMVTAAAMVMALVLVIWWARPPFGVRGGGGGH